MKLNDFIRRPTLQKEPPFRSNREAKVLDPMVVGELEHKHELLGHLFLSPKRPKAKDSATTHRGKTEENHAGRCIGKASLSLKLGGESAGVANSIIIIRLHDISSVSQPCYKVGFAFVGTNLYSLQTVLH